jgi:hypothetical protein
MTSARGLSVASLAAVVLAAVFLVPPVSKADDSGSLTGTWVIFAEPMPGVRVPALHTYNSDGTIVSADVLTFGGLPGVSVRITPLHGVWDRTGRRSFTTTNLTLVYDAASSVLIGFGRARVSLTMDKHDTSRFSATSVVEFLACPSPVACPDPQSADAAWVPFPGLPPSLPVTAERLRPVK